MDLLLATNNPHKVAEYRALLGGLPVRLVTPAEIGLALDVPEGSVSYAANAVAKASAFAAASGCGFDPPVGPAPRVAKASAFAAASGLLALADDSGLEVAALGGAPGVQSARFGGPGLTDAGRVAYLLDKLAGVPWRRRRARFRCVIALAIPGSTFVRPVPPPTSTEYKVLSTESPRTPDRLSTQHSVLSTPDAPAPQTVFVEGACRGFIATAPAGPGGFGYDPVFYLPHYRRTMAELPAEGKNRLSHRARAAMAIRAILRRLC